MHLELCAKRTVGVHYATWILSEEHYLAPAQELNSAALAKGLQNWVIPGQLGRTVVIPVSGACSDDESVGSAGDTSICEETGEGIKPLEGNMIEARGGRCVVWH
jgi:hypothetical protein